MEELELPSRPHALPNISINHVGQTYFVTGMNVIKGLIFLTIILLAVINNILVIVSVVLYRRLRHVNNYFLVSLAFADLFVALFAMTFNAVLEVSGRWSFGQFLCDFYNSMDVHLSTVSTLHLPCIALDRKVILVFHS